MQIEAIIEITSKEQEELDKLEVEAKHRGLTQEEASRQIFLEMKQFWNCEC